MNYLNKLNRTTNYYNLVKCWFGTSVRLNMKIGGEDSKLLIKSMPVKDEGNIGEKRSELDSSGYTKICDFPNADTPNRLFEGIPFKDTNIIYIYSSKNNTCYTLSESNGHPILKRSCGMEGFLNARKGTNIAAQVTGLAFAKQVLAYGVTSARVCIKGLGAGRAVSIKSIHNGGINIISITDTSPISDYPAARPKKQRRV